MTFTLRETTVSMTKKLLNVYNMSPRMAMLEVGTGGGKTYGAIHTAATIDPNLHLLLISTKAILNTKQWDIQIDDYNTVMNTHLTFTAFNYDKLPLKAHYPNIVKAITDNYNQGKRSIIILDEVHMVKLASDAKSSKRANKLISLTRMPQVLTTLGLSATTVSNSLLDMSTYLIIAGFYESTRDFISTHVKRYDEYHTPVIKDKSGEIRDDFFKNPEDIKNLYNMITVRVDTSMYMPEVISTRLNFKLQPEQRKQYRKVILDYDNGLYEFPVQVRSAQNKLLANQLFAQKDLALIGILEKRDAKEFDGIVTPILIFYEYTATLDHIDRILKVLYPDDPIFYLSGSRKKPKNMGKPDNNRAIYLIQYASGAEGLDWQWSNVSVFYEAAVRSIKYVQSQGRNVRNKSIMPRVYHYFFKFEGTIDAQRWLLLQQKRNFTTRLSKEFLNIERTTSDESENLNGYNY